MKHFWTVATILQLLISILSTLCHGYSSNCVQYGREGPGCQCMPSDRQSANSYSSQFLTGRNRNRTKMYYCCCSGISVTRVPTDLNPNVTNLHIDAAPNLRYFAAKSLEHLKIKKLSIQDAARLKKIDGVLMRHWPIRIVSIKRTGLKYPPEIKMPQKLPSHQITNRSEVDLSHNQIQVIQSGQMENVTFVNLDLSYNRISTVEDNAFIGSTIYKLILKRNPVSELRDQALSGLKTLDLDLSYTQITQLPEAGLENLRNISLEGTPGLTKLPSLVVFRNLKNAKFHWPYHCCLLHRAKPEWTAPDAKRILEPQMKEYRTKYCSNPDNIIRSPDSDGNSKWSWKTGENGDNYGFFKRSLNWLKRSVIKRIKRFAGFDSIEWGDPVDVHPSKKMKNGGGKPNTRDTDQKEKNKERQKVTSTNEVIKTESGGFFNWDHSQTDDSAAGSQNNDNNNNGDNDDNNNGDDSDGDDGTWTNPSEALLNNDRPQTPLITEEVCRQDFIFAVKKKFREVNCVPESDALNPCEDIVGYVGLRVVIWFVWISAIVLNITVLLVLFLTHHPRMRVHYCLMMNLAFADLMVGVYMAMLAIKDVRTQGEYYNYAVDWQSGPGCQAAGFIAVFASELSIFSMLLIAFDSWYNIRFGFYGESLQLKWAAKLICFSWIVALVFATLPLIGLSSYSATSTCLPLQITNIWDQLYLFSVLIINVLIFVGMFGFYLSLYFTVAGYPSTTSERSAEDVQVAKKMAILIVTDLVCWAPTVFFGLTAAANSPLITISQAKFCLIIFYPINSMANPFLYVLLTKMFRKDMGRLMRKNPWMMRFPLLLNRNRHQQMMMNHSVINQSKNNQSRSPLYVESYLYNQRPDGVGENPNETTLTNTHKISVSTSSRAGSALSLISSTFRAAASTLYRKRTPTERAGPVQQMTRQEKSGSSPPELMQHAVNQMDMQQPMEKNKKKNKRSSSNSSSNKQQQSAHQNYNNKRSIINPHYYQRNPHRNQQHRRVGSNEMGSGGGGERHHHEPPPSNNLRSTNRRESRSLFSIVVGNLFIGGAKDNPMAVDTGGPADASNHQAAAAKEHSIELIEFGDHSTADPTTGDQNDDFPDHHSGGDDDLLSFQQPSTSAFVENGNDPLLLQSSTNSSNCADTNTNNSPSNSNNKDETLLSSFRRKSANTLRTFRPQMSRITEQSEHSHSSNSGNSKEGVGLLQQQLPNSSSRPLIGHQSSATSTSSSADSMAETQKLLEALAGATADMENKDAERSVRPQFDLIDDSSNSDEADIIAVVPQNPLQARQPNPSFSPTTTTGPSPSLSKSSGIISSGSTGHRPRHVVREQLEDNNGDMEGIVEDDWRRASEASCSTMTSQRSAASTTATDLSSMYSSASNFSTATNESSGIDQYSRDNLGWSGSLNWQCNYNSSGGGKSSIVSNSTGAKSKVIRRRESNDSGYHQSSLVSFGGGIGVGGEGGGGDTASSSCSARDLMISSASEPLPSFFPTNTTSYCPLLTDLPSPSGDEDGDLPTPKVQKPND